MIQYEITPYKKTLARAIEHFVPGTRLTITCSQSLGIERTVDVAVMLTALGYVAVPHLAVRAITSHDAALNILERLRENGVTNIFVIAGDGPQTGPYPDSLTFLRANREVLKNFAVGIAAYPTGIHRHASFPELTRAFACKLPYAKFIVTQLASKTAIRRWLTEIRNDGCDLPIYIGFPSNAPARRILSCLWKHASWREALLYAWKNPRLVTDAVLKGKFTQSSLEEFIQTANGNSLGPVYRHIYTFNAF